MVHYCHEFDASATIFEDEDRQWLIEIPESNIVCVGISCSDEVVFFNRSLTIKYVQKNKHDAGYDKFCDAVKEEDYHGTFRIDIQRHQLSSSMVWIHSQPMNLRAMKHLSLIPSFRRSGRDSIELLHPKYSLILTTFGKDVTALIITTVVELIVKERSQESFEEKRKKGYNLYWMYL